MKYEEISEGMRVRNDNARGTRTRSWVGTVVGKELVTINGEDRERVYVDTDQGRRALCSPNVLTLVVDA